MDQADVVVYRDMVTIVRDRVQDMVKKGTTLAQVKSAQPTLDYDPLYGSSTIVVSINHESPFGSLVRLNTRSPSPLRCMERHSYEDIQDACGW